jgi:hypothetical protein
MTKKIKLMLDYGCSPLWWYESEKVGNIDPSQLPLSQEIIKNLEDLAMENDQCLNWDDPANTEEATTTEIEYFEQKLISLWQQLQTELSPQYQVVYFSEKLRKVITNISEVNFKNELILN